MINNNSQKLFVNPLLGAQPHQVEAILRNHALLNGKKLTNIPLGKGEKLSCYPNSQSPYNPQLTRVATFMAILKTKPS